MNKTLIQAKLDLELAKQNEKEPTPKLRRKAKLKSTVKDEEPSLAEKIESEKVSPKPSPKVEKKVPEVPEGFIKEITISGRCTDHWKTGNLLGDYEFYAWDKTGRPKFMSKVKTDLGKHSALFYFEDMECWHVSGRMKNPKNSFCWLFCKSTAMHPLEIKEQWWNEAHDNPKEQSGKHSKKANKLGFKPKAANIIISYDDKL